MNEQPLDAAELSRISYCFANAGLLRCGYIETIYVDDPNGGRNVDGTVRHVHWGRCATLKIHKLRLRSWHKNGATPAFSALGRIEVRRPVLWIFWTWVEVEGPGPWWDVIRKAIPTFEAEIARTVVTTGAFPAAKSGTLSLVKFCDDHAWTGVGECPECVQDHLVKCSKCDYTHDITKPCAFGAGGG